MQGTAALSKKHDLQQHDLMTYLLLNGADVNIINFTGMSLLVMVCCDKVDNSKTARLLLSWGAELFVEGKQLTKEQKLDLSGAFYRKGKVAAFVKLLSSDLGGRRCEIVSVPNTHDDLVGKTCVVEEYIKESDQYKVTMEFTNEVLLLGMENLKRRDRTPQDPGYYVEFKKNRLIRHYFWGRRPPLYRSCAGAYVVYQI